MKEGKNRDEGGGAGEAQGRCKFQGRRGSRHGFLTEGKSGEGGGKLGRKK